MALPRRRDQRIVPMGTMQTAHDPKLLEVRHLRLVRAVAREASVTRAAGALHLARRPWPAAAFGRPPAGVREPTSRRHKRGRRR